MLHKILGDENSDFWMQGDIKIVFPLRSRNFEMLAQRGCHQKL